MIGGIEGYRASMAALVDHVFTRTAAVFSGTREPRYSRITMSSPEDFEDEVTGTVKDAERSPEEKGLVRRLDMFLMTFGCISQVIKVGSAHFVGTEYLIEFY